MRHLLSAVAALAFVAGVLALPAGACEWTQTSMSSSSTTTASSAQSTPQQSHVPGQGG